VASLVGRQRELACLEQALAQACAGRGSLVLLKGEPGIGKSSLGREVSLRAHQAGMRVLSGRCWEGGGAAPYWPWLQVFRELGSTPFEELARDSGGDSQQRRFQLFDAASRLLTQSAAKVPLCLFLDDLHAADLPSLLLLLFVARHLTTAPLLVVATSREVEARLSADSLEVLAKLGREAEVLSLTRLTRDEVAEWTSRVDGTSHDADELFRITEGNPLFVHELLRHGVASSSRRTSDTINVALDEHLRHLSQEARDLLEVAAVLGREIGSRELADVAGIPHDIALDLLRHASDVGVLEPIGRAAFHFTHVLLRDRLYESLPTARRSALHWRAGKVGQAHGAEPARVANHLLEGAGEEQAEEAAQSALGAAEQALGRLAFEAAAELAERGLLALNADTSELACHLHIVRGEGLIRSGSIPEGRDHCIRAADIATTLGRADELAQAALTYGAEWSGVPGVDPVMVRLLEAGLRAVGPEDSPLAARLAARLGNALKPPRSHAIADRIGELVRSAVAMARRLGDPGTLLQVLDLGRQALAFVAPSDERFELTGETVRLAQALGQRLILLKLGPSYAVSLLERGFRAEADAMLAATLELYAAVDDPQSRWRAPMLRAGFCFFDGQLDEAERLGDEARALADQIGAKQAYFEWAVQRIALAIARGEPGALVEHAPELINFFNRSTAPYQGFILAAVGRRMEALNVLNAVTADEQGFPTLIVEVTTCVLLGDPERAITIERGLDLRGFGEAFFWGFAGGSLFGPMQHARGELALLGGRVDEARRHFEDSVALCQRIGCKVHLERSLLALERLQASSVAPATPAPAPAPARPSQPAPARLISLQREGDVWAVQGSGTASFRLKDSKGLAYLNELLSNPDREIHVLSLVGLEQGAGDAGPVLDARAKAAYKRRLEELEDELKEAENFADAGRANRARQELDALATQLAGAVGLGGRDRRAASDVERARINVQRRLKDALDSITELDPALGRYLSAAVKTGTYCSYTPV
jgi:AAA ATPase domain